MEEGESESSDAAILNCRQVAQRLTLHLACSKLQLVLRAPSVLASYLLLFGFVLWFFFFFEYS